MTADKAIELMDRYDTSRGYKYNMELLGVSMVVARQIKLLIDVCEIKGAAMQQCSNAAMQQCSNAAMQQCEGKSELSTDEEIDLDFELTGYYRYSDVPELLIENLKDSGVSEEDIRQYFKKNNYE